MVVTVCSSLFVSSSATNETYLLTYEAFENVKVGVLGYWAFYFLAGVAFGGSWSASFPDLSALLATVLSFVTFVHLGRSRDSVFWVRRNCRSELQDQEATGSQRVDASDGD